jgi:hypothetical protein
MFFMLVWLMKAYTGHSRRSLLICPSLDIYIYNLTVNNPAEQCFYAGNDSNRRQRNTTLQALWQSS